MIHQSYADRFADIILSSDYELKLEIEDVIQSVGFDGVQARFEEENAQRRASGKSEAKDKQSTINGMFREEFDKRGWEVEKNVFDDPDNDLTIDFWKRNVGVDVAFVDRSFIGGDLLRLQAAAEAKEVIKVGAYISPTRAFARAVSPDVPSMVNYDRAKWYLDKFHAVLTAPILLTGLSC